MILSILSFALGGLLGAAYVANRAVKLIDKMSAEHDKTVDELKRRVTKLDGLSAEQDNHIDDYIDTSIRTEHKNSVLSDAVVRAEASDWQSPKEDLEDLDLYGVGICKEAITPHMNVPLFEEHEEDSGELASYSKAAITPHGNESLSDEQKGE